MNTKISAIATSVYALVTVMPKYSRSISFLHPQGKRRSGGNRRGADTGNGTQHHSLVYSEVNTLLTIERKRNLRSRFAFVPKIKTGQSLFQLRTC